jgi:SpoVK/Ycf46/Vps4 family AAA+-type ATPase
LFLVLVSFCLALFALHLYDLTHTVSVYQYQYLPAISFRRLVKRIYVPLPDAETRAALISHLMAKQGPSGAPILQPETLTRVVQLTQGYSGSDLTAVRNIL